MRRRLPSLPTLAITAITMISLIGLTANVADARDSMTLRVNDAVGEPGGLVAIVVRTYAPRPISQGQISVRVKRAKRAKATRSDRDRQSAPPPMTLESYKVFSGRNDAQVEISVTNSGSAQIVSLQFSSKSGTVNRSDGPLAVMYFRLDDTVRPRQEFEVSLVAARTTIINAQGAAVRVVPRSGRLRIRRPEINRGIEVRGDKVKAGDVARVALTSFEPAAMSRGHIELRYDPSVTAAPPTVEINKKYGRLRFDIDVSTPGLIIVDFRSPNATWNFVPGEIMRIEFPTSVSVPVGTRSLVEVDANATVLLDDNGEPLLFQFTPGFLRFKARSDDDDDDSNSSDDDDDADDDSGSSDDDDDSDSSDDDDSDSSDDDDDSDSSDDDNDSDSSDDDDDSDDDDSDDDVDAAEFKGKVGSVTVDGTSGTLTMKNGPMMVVDATTVWDVDGDFVSLQEVAVALDADGEVRVEGDSTLRDNGSVLITAIKAETDDN